MRVDLKYDAGGKKNAEVICARYTRTRPKKIKKCFSQRLQKWRIRSCVSSQRYWLYAARYSTTDLDAVEIFLSLYTTKKYSFSVEYRHISFIHMADDSLIVLKPLKHSVCQDVCHMKYFHDKFMYAIGSVTLVTCVRVHSLCAFSKLNASNLRCKLSTWAS